MHERSRRVSKQHERVAEITAGLVDHPTDAEPRYEAGKIMVELGMKEEGEAWLKSALQVQPGHQAARELLSRDDGTKDQPSKGVSQENVRSPVRETTSK